MKSLALLKNMLSLSMGYISRYYQLGGNDKSSLVPGVWQGRNFPFF
jgi:hypothetical protein